jgi:hypothetical protein
VVFDLWDEVFRIELSQGGRRRETVAVNIEGVLRRCTEARRLPLVSVKSLESSRRYFVGVLVEVNPLSKEMMERIKRWVARPKGAGNVGPGDSLFGSFVGLFITQVPDADRVLNFRGAPFVPVQLPELPPDKDKRTWRAPDLGVAARVAADERLEATLRLERQPESTPDRRHGDGLHPRGGRRRGSPVRGDWR